MNAGDVELSGAVDFNPNELSEKPKTQEVKNAETTVETANKPASIKEEDVRFYSDKIKSGNDMFVRVEGGERRERAMKRREERERKEALREAKMAEKREGASGLVGESEKALKKEQRRLAKEQRKQKRSERWSKIFGWFKKHWYIFAGIVVVAAIVGGVFLVSNIVADMQAKQAAVEKEQFIQENKTDVQRVFVEVAGKELTKEKIDEIVKRYNGTVVVEYYPQAVSIRAKDSFTESVSSPFMPGGKGYRDFAYNSRVGSDRVAIYKTENGGYEYFHKNSQLFGSFDEALGAYLLEKKEVEGDS